MPSTFRGSCDLIMWGEDRKGIQLSDTYTQSSPLRFYIRLHKCPLLNSSRSWTHKNSACWISTPMYTVKQVQSNTTVLKLIINHHVRFIAGLDVPTDWGLSFCNITQRFLGSPVSKLVTTRSQSTMTTSLGRHMTSILVLWAWSQVINQVAHGYGLGWLASTLAPHHEQTPGCFPFDWEIAHLHHKRE